MLWSLIKIVVFIALVAAVAWGAGQLMALEGGVTINIAGLEEVNLTPLKTIIALVVLALVIWLLLKLAALLLAVLKFVNGDETALTRYFSKNRQEKGYAALSEGILALASGDGQAAMAKAARADKYLHKPALTNLITAQGAELAGDRKKAEQVYKRLLMNEKTRFVGVRGILKQKLAEGDTETALQLAKTAFSLKPRQEDVQDTLLKLQAETEDWKGARETLNAKLKYGSLPRDVHRRRDAVLALSEASGILDEGNDIAAREAAIEANRLSPDLVPAAVLAAQGYLAEGKKRPAARVIKKAWEAQPHPDLAASFAEIEPNETPAQRFKRFRKLTGLHPDHRETRLLEAELLIANEDFPAARRALGDLAEVDPDARALTIMAAVERGEGASDAVIKGWLARAVSAPRGPQWICENCHHIHAEWAPSCGNCRAFDTLAWKAPPATAVSSSTGMEMLPLIVGSLDDESRADEADSAVVDAEIITPEDADKDTPEAGVDPADEGETRA